MRNVFLLVAIALTASCTTSGSVGFEPGSWSIDRRPPTLVESTFSTAQNDAAIPTPHQQPTEPPATINTQLEVATDGETEVR